MEDKIQKFVGWLEETIAEMYEYAESDEYDNLEQHDCRVAADAYELVLHYVKTELIERRNET